MHECEFCLEEFDFGDNLILEVKMEREDGSKLVEHIACVGTVSPLNGSRDKFVKLVVIDAPVVCSISSAEDCIGDVRAGIVGNGFGGDLFCANNRLVFWLMQSPLSCVLA